MTRGTVKWFSEQKGYGFISAEGRDDVFVHHSVIQGTGFRTLQEGEQVQFETRASERGEEAALVQRV